MLQILVLKDKGWR